MPAKINALKAATATRRGEIGKHKTSMLQVVEAGRAIEIDASVGSVVELGKLTATPTTNARYQAARLLAYTIETGMMSVGALRDPGPQ